MEGTTQHFERPGIRRRERRRSAVPPDENEICFGEVWRQRGAVCQSPSPLPAVPAPFLLTEPSVLCRTSWPGTERAEYYKKKIRNQSTTGGFGAKEFLIVFGTKQV